ncbi:cytochrome-c oxidase fixP chain, partial [Lentisphaera araneosa HTCC2155]
MKKQSFFIIVIALAIGLHGGESITRGKALYDTVCFACHGKKLEGAAGPNLKDFEWLHGASREQIISSIKKGFPEKGMVAFGALYNEQQIADLANYVLSRQEGVRSMEYKIYHNVTMDSGIDWKGKRADKQGQSLPPTISLTLPEVDQFAMKFEGELLIPKDLVGNYQVRGVIRQKRGFELFVDGKKVDLSLMKGGRFQGAVELTAGNHHLEVFYIKDFRDGTLLLDLYGKTHIPLAAQSYQKSKTSSLIVKANDSYLISRKRIAELPAGAIVVNHKDQISYAIDPKTASINAIWQGKSLDIGPNIYARGQQTAKLLGEHLFPYKKDLKLLINGQVPQLRFKGYEKAAKPR